MDMNTNSGEAIYSCIPPARYNIYYTHTVEPLYSGLIGTSEFVLIMEVSLLYLEVKLYSKVLVRDLNECLY